METNLLFNTLAVEIAPPLPAVNSSVAAMPLPTLAPARRASSAIAFVDGGIAQYQNLTASVKTGVDVYVLDPLQDEIKQITKVLAGRTSVSSLHIISHGATGDLKLGALNLNLSGLGTYSSDLQAWAQALTADADILLYGCNVASGDQGKQFVMALSQLTGADIAASIDLTGNVAQGGNWVLEYATGKIEATSALTANVLAYQGVLVAPTVTLTTTPLAYTEGGTILLDSGVTVQDPDSVNFNGGKLTVSLTAPAGSDRSGDRLLVQPGGQIGLDGKTINYITTSTVAIGTFTGGSGNEDLVINFNSNATPAATQSLLKQIAYANVARNLPPSSSRTVQISLNDGTATSLPVSRVINLTGVNNAPAIGQALTLYNGSGKPEDSVWLAYQDSSTVPFVGQGAATVVARSGGGITFTTGKDTAGKDAYAGYSNYAVNYTIVPLNISTTLKNANFPKLNRADGYTLSFTAGLSAETHSGSDRNSDGKDDRAGFSVLVVGEDQKAIELGFWSDRIFAQSDGTTQINPALEPDGTAANSTRTLFTQAESAIFNTTALTAYDLTVLGDGYTLFASGQAVLSGKLRDYTAFTPQTVAGIKPPSPYAQKNLIFLGDNTPAASATLQLTNVAVTTNGLLPPLTVDEDKPLIISNLRVSDVDAGNNPLTVTLSASGTLTVNSTIGGGATIATNGTSRVVLTGTLAQINATLLNATGLTYVGKPDATGMDSLKIEVNDGITAQPTTKTLNISLNPVNDAPKLDLNGVTAGTGYVADFARGEGPVAIVDDLQLTVSDIDSLRLASATITITNPRNLGSEVLAATTTGTSITATYDSSRGILRLTGSDLVSNYQKVLRTITYNNPAAIPDYTTRTINFVVNDGILNSQVATTTLILQSTANSQSQQFDFTGDGKADLVWRNNFTQETAIWEMNGFELVRSTLLPKVDDNWRIEAIGDFDGNGQGDFLWRNYVTREVAIWRMNGTKIAETGFLRSMEFDWQFVGVGDFNGDRKDDLLLRNTVTGENGVWLIDGVKFSTGYFIDPLANSNWLVAGVADFNGDRKADIVWRNETTGQNAIWLLNGATIANGSFLDSTPAAWQIVAVGDLNGDGKADLIWRNGATGDNAVWLMNGVKPTLQTLIDKVPDQNWQIAGAGDFDRDGKADLVWRNYSTGENAIWQMNGGQIKDARLMRTKVADLDWYIS